MKRSHKTVVVWMFLIILFLPAMLSVVSFLFDCTLDLQLNGYTENVEEKRFSREQWLNGAYQTSITERWAGSFLPRGLLIKIYNTINFYLFNKSQKIIGKDLDIFEPEYINAELTLTDRDDFSLPENIEELNIYVDQLQQFQSFLKNKGITLYLYIAPSKASVHRFNIPDRYFGGCEDHVRAVDAFRKQIRGKGIPYLICSDLLTELEYPAFYTTGIHWSRTYEQFASQKIINSISEITGNIYNNIVFTGVEESTEPWFRDSDVYDLTNIFFRPEVTYYQYTTELEKKENSKRLRILIQGDSFALGLRKDIIENDPMAEVYYVFRDETVVDRNEKHHVFYGDWSDVDWNEYIKNIDVVVLEATEPLIREYSFGFVQFILQQLQTAENE